MITFVFTILTRKLFLMASYIPIQKSGFKSARIQQYFNLLLWVAGSIGLKMGLNLMCGPISSSQNTTREYYKEIPQPLNKLSQSVPSTFLSTGALIADGCSF